MASSERYPIPAGFARTEQRVVNSRFLGSVACTPSVEEARAFIAALREEFPDATHHAYAYLVGYGASVTAGMSDDGEPSGTAGRPMLAVLRGSGLGDVTVVATRFFGGTLLGTGGLVRAYSDTTRAVLDVVERTERVERCRMQVRVDYSLYTLVRRAIESFETAFEHEDFASDVTLVVALPVSEYDACAALVAELSAGQAEIVRQEASVRTGA
jgi:uncharacterized YigZ family protein